MFIALYFIIANLAMPKVAETASGLTGTIAVIIITIICIRIVMSLIGVHTSGRTSGMVVDSIVRSLEFIFRKAVEAIGWVVRKTVDATPNVYRKSKRFYSSKGINNMASTALAILTAIVFVAIII